MREGKTMYLISITMLAGLLIPLGVSAGEDSVPAVTDPLVKEECGACHMAFQPAFLPGASWRKMLSSLDNHFGEDASLDVGTRNMIESYMVAHAGRGQVTGGKPPMRITGLYWFRDEHNDTEVEMLRKNHNVKTLADCGACHRGADRGNFDDD